MATIKEREPKVKAACYEAAAIIEDWRAQCIGGFRSALDLFELAILPTLLYNAETWVEISREAEERLENIQLFYLRLVLRLPKGTPKPALLSETGYEIQDMEEVSVFFLILGLTLHPLSRAS